MINDFFINILLLISVIFIGGHLSKDIPVNYNFKITRKMLIGFGGGILAILMMIYTINIKGTDTLVDLRIIALMIAYYIGGLASAIITGTMSILFRTIYYGINQSAMVAAFQVIILIAAYYMLSKLKLDIIKKWVFMHLISMFVMASTYYYLLFVVSDVHVILIKYIFVSTIAAILAYYLLLYVKSANELYRRYKSAASIDFLTGLSNTRQFDITFNTSVAKAKEKGEQLSCLMVDIDHFKNVNDTYGHGVGDIVLRDLAAVMRNTCSSIAAISRVGGEEFCVLVPNCSIEQAIEIGKQICDGVKTHKFDIGLDRYINITVSVGIATYPETVENSEMLLKQADDSLYKAKQTGRDRVCSSDTCNI